MTKKKARTQWMHSPMRFGAFSKIRQCCFLQGFWATLPSRMNVDQQKWLPFTCFAWYSLICLDAPKWISRVQRDFLVGFPGGVIVALGQRTWTGCRQCQSGLRDERVGLELGTAEGPGWFLCIMWQYVANHCKPFGFFTAYRVTLRIVYSLVYHINRCQMYIVL